MNYNAWTCFGRCPHSQLCRRCPVCANKWAQGVINGSNRSTAKHVFCSNIFQQISNILKILISYLILHGWGWKRKIMTHGRHGLSTGAKQKQLWIHHQHQQKMFNHHQSLEFEQRKENRLISTLFKLLQQTATFQHMTQILPSSRWKRKEKRSVNHPLLRLAIVVKSQNKIVLTASCTCCLCTSISPNKSKHLRAKLFKFTKQTTQHITDSWHLSAKYCKEGYKTPSVGDADLYWLCSFESAFWLCSSIQRLAKLNMCSGSCDRHVSNPFTSLHVRSANRLNPQQNAEHAPQLNRRTTPVSVSVIPEPYFQHLSATSGHQGEIYFCTIYNISTWFGMVY